MWSGGSEAVSGFVPAPRDFTVTAKTSATAAIHTPEKHRCCGFFVSVVGGFHCGQKIQTLLLLHLDLHLFLFHFYAQKVILKLLGKVFDKCLTNVLK